jgi:hypothetical protein
MMSLLQRLREWRSGQAFSTVLIAEAVEAIENRDKALLWYQERAKSLNEHLEQLSGLGKASDAARNAVTVKAILTELSLDAGTRATEAMRERSI